MRAQNGTRDCRGELACVMPLTRFPHIETHLHIVPHGKLVVLPGAAGLPGRCRGAAGVLPGAAGLPGTWTHILTAGLGSLAAGLPGCRGCRVLPGLCRVAGVLPGWCRVRLPGCWGQHHAPRGFTKLPPKVSHYSPLVGWSVVFGRTSGSSEVGQSVGVTAHK